ncbi:TIGR02270 family protein [Myxococcus xanthus]|uniref:TIGR02270 family protein n=1 Tax=Myxococcus xanthus TaxID=34 RepID=UPI0019175926|nr:TIGR02270 family protein [Myxococcus xanthus]QQR44280.1 TIGR02270 family protein [Myxococcus xanthus]
MTNKPTWRPPHWSNYETHLDEAAFRLSQWEAALDAPDFILDEAAELEEQLAAHIDGLVLGGQPVARQLLEPSLASEEPEHITVAALSLLKGAAPSGTAAVLSALESAEPPALAALQRALGLAPFPALLSSLPALLQKDDALPELQALVLDTLGQHGVATLQQCLPWVTHPVPQVAAAALRAASRSRLPLEPAHIQRAMNSASSDLRDAAIVAGLLSGHSAAWTACQAATAPGGTGGRLPLLLLGLNGDERDLKRLLERLSDKSLQADVLWALGFSGRLDAADACVELLGQGPIAALAGESFSAITGLRIEGDFAIPKDAQEAEEPVPLEEDDLDADLKPKPEDSLPTPNAMTVAAWWQQTRPKLDARQRYLSGQPHQPKVLLDALISAPMRRRHALALDLELRSRGALRVPTRMFMAQQVEAWKKAQGAPTSTFNRPFAEALRS